MTKFSDSNWDLLNEYFSVINGAGTSTHDSYLYSPEHTIVTEGGSYVELYENNSEYGYIGHNFVPVSNEGNIFKFRYSSISSSASVFDGITTVTNGSEMYFRKGGYFHQWLLNNSTEYRDYINTNKMFIYFGKIWPSDSDSLTTYVIEFKGLKDFMLEALPPINRTTAMTDWLEGYFDRTHQPIYNLTKNIWSLRDPKEIDIRFLEYIADEYGIKIKQDLTTELALREWVDNLIYFLKRKGDYSTLYIVYKFLLTNTSNTLNIYERWHEWDISTYRDAPIPSDWEDHHILEYYSIQPSGAAGNDYYLRYDPNGYPIYGTSDDIDSLILHYKFDETTGLTASDNVGSNDGTLTYFIDDDSQWVDGKFNNGLEFNSHDSTYVDIGSPLQSTFRDSFTLGYYIKHNIINHSQYHFVADNKGNHGVVVFITNDNYMFVIYKNGLNSTTWVSKNRILNSVETSFDKYFIVFDASDGIRVYKNGVLIESDSTYDGNLVGITMASYTSTENALIGTYITGVGAAEGVLNGVVDDFKIFNEALTISQMKSLTLSPHYRVEIDLTSEPLGDDYIINESVIDELIRYWNYTKPVSRFVTYTELIAPDGVIDAWDSEEISLYNTDELAYLTTQFVGASFLSSAESSAGFGLNTYYHRNNTHSNIWNVVHSLGTSATITQTYEGGNLILPNSVEIVNSNDINIEFDTSIKGNTLVAIGNYSTEFTVPIYSDLPDESNLILYYKLDETTGTTSSEEQASGYDGTFLLGPGDDSQWTTGQTNNGLKFDGSDDWLRISHTPIETLGQNEFSLSFWLKALTQSATKNIFGIYDWQSGPNVNAFYSSLYNDGEMQVVYRSDNNTATVDSDQSLISDWTDDFHHIVITLDGITMKLYMDSTLVTSFTGGADGDMSGITMANFDLSSGSSDYFAFGTTRWNTSNINEINAIFDEIRFYDVAVTADQVTALYNNDN